MDTGETTPGRSKKVFIITLGVVVVIAAGVAFLLVKNQRVPQPETGEQASLVGRKVLTQEEKIQIIADLTQLAPQNTMSQAEKTRTLQDLTKKAPKVPNLSDEEKVRILQELAVKAVQ